MDNFMLTLDTKTDKDILNWLKSQSNPEAAVKKVIRYRIRAEKDDLEANLKAIREQLDGLFDRWSN